MKTYFLNFFKTSFVAFIFFMWLAACSANDPIIDDNDDNKEEVDNDTLVNSDTISGTDSLNDTISDIDSITDTIFNLDTIIDSLPDTTFVVDTVIIIVPDTSYLYSKTPVEAYGQLRVEGTKIVSQYNKSIQLRGMSFFWSQWIGKYYNYDCVKWLRDDWRCTVVRAAMAVESGGYLTNKETEKDKVKEVVETAIDLGIYVIIDWHDHNAQNHQKEAVTFFSEMAQLYGNYPNVIYEPFNEPLEVSWKNVLKPYHKAVISAIRQFDPDNIVICGTRTWSQQIVEASKDPLEDKNVAYTLHYYAATHKQWLRNNAATAIKNGVALWVTEYGTTESSGTGYIDVAESEAWWDFMDQNQISWCNWSIADKNENSAALLPGANAKGGWDESMISTSGKMVRDELISKNPAK